MQLTSSFCNLTLNGNDSQNSKTKNVKTLNHNNICIIFSSFLTGTWLTAWQNVCFSITKTLCYVVKISGLPIIGAIPSTLSHHELRKFVQGLCEEIINFPSTIDFSGVPGRLEEPLPIFDPKKYEKLLATAVLNKVKLWFLWRFLEISCPLRLRVISLCWFLRFFLSPESRLTRLERRLNSRSLSKPRQKLLKHYKLKLNVMRKRLK